MNWYKKSQEEFPEIASDETIRDINGGSRYLYRGTSLVQKIPSSPSIGIFFSNNPVYASKYGKVVNVYEGSNLNILDLKDGQNPKAVNILNNFFKKYGDQKVDTSHSPWPQNPIIKQTGNWLDHATIFLFPNKKWISYLKIMGYDGTETSGNICIFNINKLNFVGILNTETGQIEKISFNFLQYKKAQEKQKEFPEIAKQVPGEEVLMENLMENFSESSNEAISNILEEFISSKPEEKQPWPVVPFDRVNKIWRDYMTYGIIRDERGMNEIADRMIKNVHRLYANTLLMGHTPDDPEEYFEDYKIDEKSRERFYWEYAVDESGQARISDYAMDDLQKDVLKLMKARTAEEKLQIVDRMFNRIHQRSDLPAMFIEGGTDSLDMLFGRPTQAFNLKWYKKSQVTIEEDIFIDQSDRPSLENVTSQQWQDINDRMMGKKYDFRGRQDTQRIYEKLNRTTGGLPKDHKEVLDAVLEGKEYIKKEDPRKIKNIFNKSIRYFGLTNDLNEAGYILPNGKLLDLSGKKHGEPSGKRQLDHSDINEIADMSDFISMGAIRHFPEQPGIDIRVSPTSQQLSIIWRDVDNSVLGYTVELFSPYKGRFFEQYDPGIKGRKVINDIENFYNFYA